MSKKQRKYKITFRTFKKYCIANYGNIKCVHPKHILYPSFTDEDIKCCTGKRCPVLKKLKEAASVE